MNTEQQKSFWIFIPYNHHGEVKSALLEAPPRHSTLLEATPRNVGGGKRYELVQTWINLKAQSVDWCSWRKTSNKQLVTDLAWRLTAEITVGWVLQMTSLTGCVVVDVDFSTLYGTRQHCQKKKRKEKKKINWPARLKQLHDTGQRQPSQSNSIMTHGRRQHWLGHTWSIHSLPTIMFCTVDWTILYV